jgi:hypothetical protein
MAPLRNRILKRGLTAAAVMAVLGVAVQYLFWAAMSQFPNVQVEGGIGFQGPLIFALFGFAVAAAVECVRRDKPKSP